MQPEARQMAIHHAGHAVVQTLIKRTDMSVARVAMNGCCRETWRGLPALGESILEQEARLSLYEFGLVTLAGIAAEERYTEETHPDEEPLVALSDLSAWQEGAWRVLHNEAQIRLVGINVMRKLKAWMADEDLWWVVETLAEELLDKQMLQGDALQQILSPLARSG